MLSREHRGQGRPHQLTGKDYAIYALKQMQRRDKKMLEAHRAHAEITKDLSFGRLAFSAPQDHYELLTMIYPEMQSPDAEIKTKFYKSIGNLELFQPYLINPKERLTKPGSSYDLY